MASKIIIMKLATQKLFCELMNYSTLIYVILLALQYTPPHIRTTINKGYLSHMHIRSYIDTLIAALFLQ